ncbi:D-hexose-6-phosphate mutarotase [Silvimonas iriomotensis]|uniref:Putative glucose-6-phosphate 1-epimerase n=1 Tax=Silvimonas iriomotensis TaxID=449662 RepID=A0ABQ2P525_9NEIS|nr:D-hexose-6-phosphate mutarotase [Silvimonas iriomotensis]GGP18461.1 D-hexose-6-phosphate mutarotase [Silvimonas iriomotensis]
MSLSQTEQQILASVPGLAIVSSTGTYAGAGLDLLTVENAGGQATIALQGAHVVSFTPRGGEDVMWISPNAQFAAGEAIRGGIPLCLPWFGPHPQDEDKPKHGFARNEIWTLVEASQPAADVTRVTLELRDNDATRALWPHAFVYRLAISVGKALHLDLAIEHKGNAPQLHSLALHTYFNVGKVTDAVITGLAGTTFIDTIPKDKPRHKQEGDVQLVGPTDRVYVDVPRTQHIKTPARSIKIDSADTHCAIVWNAWTNADKIADIGPGNYVGYLCVERGDAWEFSPTLQPGQVHHATMTLSVE